MKIIQSLSLELLHQNFLLNSLWWQNAHWDPVNYDMGTVWLYVTHESWLFMDNLKPKSFFAKGQIYTCFKFWHFSCNLVSSSKTFCQSNLVDYTVTCLLSTLYLKLHLIQVTWKYRKGDVRQFPLVLILFVPTITVLHIWGLLVSKISILIMIIYIASR